MKFAFAITCNLMALIASASAAGSHQIAEDVVPRQPTTVNAANQVVPTPTPHAVRDHKADRIVVYSATWCGPCQRLKPVLATLKQEGYKVEHLDIDRDADKLKYSHRSVPTIYFLRGETVVGKVIGYRSKDQITRMLVTSPDRLAPQKPLAPKPLNESVTHSVAGVSRF
ncbi:thioredoxin family protein [Roseiconus nitratireducens]|uniref:Thioredoxin family protein n=1 Tax=Roseiconus nitratireducens TaxID=2605748 RepID=A0A5M6DEG5_9BACT|nr:thioredoxin family protein [Roseiconus nitratireducens]KAA5543575.1 thioredoxin family protein [Roseiconus nitratireducens]